MPLSRLADDSAGRRPGEDLAREGPAARSWCSATCAAGTWAASWPRPRRLTAEQVDAAAGGRYRLEWGGQFENLEQARTRLAIVVPVALALIFVLLYVTYRRLSDVLLVFAAVPFAWSAACWRCGCAACRSRSRRRSASSPCRGVSVLNSMVLVTFIRQLRERTA